MTYALIVAATLLVVAGLTVRFARSHMLATLDQRLVSVVKSFEDGPARDVTGSEDLAPRARAWLATHAFSPEECSAVRTASGEVLSAGGMAVRDIPDADALLASTRSQIVRVAGHEGPIRVATVPLVYRGQHLGTMLVATYEAPVHRAVREILKGVVWASAIGLVFASLLGMAASRRTMRPLTRMLDEVRAIEATGDLSKRVAANGPLDEVGRLAASFDRMVARLEESFKLQQRFVSDASHELRTPLAVAKGHLELLEQEIPQAEARRSLTIAGEELERMRRIVEDLLLLARLDEGLRLVCRPVEVELVAREAVLRTMLLGHRGLDVSVQPGLFAMADPDRLLQVLSNLLTNAVAHAGRDVRITLKAQREEQSVRIDVTDSGAGIAPEDVPHVFERFFRGAKARHGVPGGAGLGLAIVASLVEAMGGSIRVTSTPGSGTAFTVLLLAPAS